MRHRIPIVVVLALAAGAACASRDAALSRTMAGIDAAARVLATADAAAQQRIVEEATSEADGRARLGVYRARRAQVEAAFVVAYAAVAAASIDLTEDALRAALSAGGAAVRAVQALATGGTP
jgi:hypothetical protein